MKNHSIQNQELTFAASIFTVCICTLFGANAVAIKISLKGLGAFTTAGLRFAIASAAIYIWAKATGRSFKISRKQVRQLMIISSVFIVQLSLFYLGLSKTNVSRGTLMANVQPFFTLFLAHFFIPGDSITKRKIIGILLGFTGVVFVFLEKKGITSDFEIGDIIILGAAFLWSCNAVYTKKIIASFKPFQITFFPMLFSVPFFFLEGFLWDKTMVAYVDYEIIGSLLYQSLITASFGFIVWNSLLQRYGAVALHSFIFIMPVAGVFLGGLVLDEPITANIITGMLLIITGILTVHYSFRFRFVSKKVLKNPAISRSISII